MEKTILLSDIVIGKRHRQDMGDIKALADSIETQGLLQPIGITESNELVFGARRIESFKLLGKDKIPARVVDVTSLVEGEHDENEIRKEFSRTERAAIALAVREEIGDRERRGNPDWKKCDDAIVDMEPQLSIGEKTRDFVAKKAGLGSGRTLEQVEKVIERGTPELQEAMDKREVSVKDAETFSRLPPNEQREALKLPKPERVAKAKSLRAPRSPKPQLDKKDETRGSHRPLTERHLPEPTTNQGNAASYTEALRWATGAISQIERIMTDDPRAEEALVSIQIFVTQRLQEVRGYAGKDSRDYKLRVV